MYDPRWDDDPRDRDHGRELNQGSRGGVSDPRHRKSVDPRDVFLKDLNLPRGPERWPVRARGGDVTLRGSESRTLSIVGAPMALTREFGDDPQKVLQWTAFVRRTRRPELRDLSTVVGTLERFLWPALQAAGRDEPWQRVWTSGGPWSEG